MPDLRATAAGSETVSRRTQLAEELEERLTPVMSSLGLLFLLVVLAEPRAEPESGLSGALSALSWLLWATFAIEYAARFTLADERGRFFRRTWWQLLFLALPFLRFLRLVQLVRVLRTSRVLSSAIRSTRSAGSLLGSRLGWLASLTAITILAVSQLLFEFGEITPYGEALHATALAAITGEPFGAEGGLAKLLEVGLAAFSVGVFATLAGSLGAYFLESRRT